MNATDLAAILDAHALWRRTNGTEGERAYLTGANLAGAYLAGADLARAYLNRADLTGAYLNRADLAGANLFGAYLSGANLARAYLFRADLTGAYLNRANLTGADLTGADLTGARSVATAGPVGRFGRIVYAIDHGDRIMVQAGCWWGSTEDLRARIAPDGDHGWGDDYARNAADYTAALAWLTQRIETAR